MQPAVVAPLGPDMLSDGARPRLRQRVSERVQRHGAA
jgi:hypothetical protein